MSVSVLAICEVIFSEAPLLMCNTVKDALKRCGVRPTIVCHHKVAGFPLQWIHFLTKCLALRCVQLSSEIG